MPKEYKFHILSNILNTACKCR